jgi:hypothetical protein
MNKQIRQLADEAGITDNNLSDGNMSHDNLAKFARLIVAECVAIVKPTNHHEVWAQSYLGGVDGLELLEDKCNKIKQHFGIEL